VISPKQRSLPDNTTVTRDSHRRDSSPQSQQTSGRRPPVLDRTATGIGLFFDGKCISGEGSRLPSCNRVWKCIFWRRSWCILRCYPHPLHSFFWDEFWPYHYGVIRRPVTAEAWIQFQRSSCGIFGRQCGIGTGCCSTNPPFSNFIHLFSTLQNRCSWKASINKTHLLRKLNTGPLVWAQRASTYRCVATKAETVTC